MSNVDDGASLASINAKVMKFNLIVDSDQQVGIGDADTHAEFHIHLGKHETPTWPVTHTITVTYTIAPLHW